MTEEEKRLWRPLMLLLKKQREYNVNITLNEINKEILLAKAKRKKREQKK